MTSNTLLSVTNGKRPPNGQGTQPPQRVKREDNRIDGGFCVTSLQYVMPFLSVEEIFQLSRINRIFKETMDSLFEPNDFWIALFDREGIPQVQQTGDQKRNLREDFIHLYQRTCVSGRMINTYLGQMVGKIPAITEEVFKRSKSEPNFGFFVRPAAVRRTIGPDFPVQLVKMQLPSPDPKQPERFEQLLYPNRDLIGEGETLTIPFGIFNLRILSDYPKKGREYAPCLAVERIDEEVFTEDFYESVGGVHLGDHQTAFHLFNRVSGTVKVDYMLRAGVLEESRWVNDYNEERGLSFDHPGRGAFVGIEAQEILLEQRGFKLAGVLPIALREVIRKLETGVSSLADFRDEFYFHNHRLRSGCGVWQNVRRALGGGVWEPTIEHLGAVPDASAFPPGTERERSLIADLYYRTRGHAMVTRAYTYECMQSLDEKLLRFAQEGIWQEGLVIGPGLPGQGLSIETSEEQFYWGDIGSVPRLRADVRDNLS